MRHRSIVVFLLLMNALEDGQVMISFGREKGGSYLEVGRRLPYPEKLFLIVP